MNEVQVQIDTLLEKRIELKNQIKELLNYGNVPDENWNKIGDLTIKLNSLSYSIELFQETQLAIKQNKGSRNSRKFKSIKFVHELQNLYKELNHSELSL